LQRARWRIDQEPDAVTYTEVPQSARALVRQRFRWMFGTLQAVWKQRRMVLNPRYGALGLAVMPYAVLSILVPLVFMPIAYWLVAQSLLGGDWRTVVAYLGVLTALHFVMAAVAVAMSREKLWHLLVVPVYRLIYEPLRTYLLYSTALAVLRGRLVGWNKLARTNTVRFDDPDPVVVMPAGPSPLPAPRTPEPEPDRVPAPRVAIQRVARDPSSTRS
jgi:biofilm PGA synthesis N-glycosyltransferase PgaC